MRIWCVKTSALDNQRLLGERKELSLMISTIVRAERRGGFSAKSMGGISKYYRDRFRFVEKRYKDQIKELRFRGFAPARMVNFDQIYSEFPALKETRKKSGWKQGGKWFQSIGRAKTDLGARWDSGISRGGGVNKPKWTKRAPPKWYTPQEYMREDDIRFDPKYRKKAELHLLAKVITAIERPIPFTITSWTPAGKPRIQSMHPRWWVNCRNLDEETCVEYWPDLQEFGGKLSKNKFKKVVASAKEALMRLQKLAARKEYKLAPYGPRALDRFAKKELINKRIRHAQRDLKQFEKMVKLLNRMLKDSRAAYYTIDI